MPAHVVQINISRGGLPKTPILQADVGVLGIAGDLQRNKKYHGGPQQALLLIASEVIDQLAQEGWPVFYGALGENVTTRGLDHRSWRAGHQLRIAGVLIKLTKPRAPCVQLNVYGAGIQARLYDAAVKALSPASKHWGESGFYAAVIKTGSIAVNDTIVAVDSVVSAALEGR